MSRPPNGSYRNASNGSASLPMPSAPGMSSQSRLATPTQPPQPRPTSSAMSRAERFEDEKRRIIESCFSKLDANGQLSESYITHIRIHEDASHPSTPPPPDSPPENKKPRLIIIAVRSTGRVRMHKARENNNGSFSIGKTWNLEELSAIETFSRSAQPPRDDREAQYRQWAGNTGFVVTISKPYYWQAGTSKEKDFFIASAVKIFRKYTKGQVPELRGFDEREQALMLGAAAPAQERGSTAPPPSSRGPSGSPAPTPPLPPFASAEQSRDGSRYRGSPGPPGSRMASDSPGRGSGMQAFRQASQQPGGPRPFASTEQMRSVSREPPRPDMRPGTSPAPAYPRAPSNGQSPASTQRTSHSQMREESPGIPPSVPSDRESMQSQNLQARPRSPLRQRSQQHPVASVPEGGQYQQQKSQHQQPSIEQNGTAAPSGPAMFASTRQRWAQQQAQQPAPVEKRQTSAPQLPPLETTRSNQSRSTALSDDRAPTTAQSEASSAGLDPTDAAAVGAMSSFWGPEPTQTAAPATPTIQEPSSPPTPERSRRRPPMDTRPSEASFDLRPQPLKQSSRTPDDRSNYATPDQGSIAATPRGGSTLATPAREEPPEVKPLAVSNKFDTNLTMPGAFTATPPGPSPLGTPLETPASEKGQDEAELGEAFRPGLGPMIRKRALADKFKKAASAASAANAFKPRAGGAAERILAAKAQREGGEPDGISAVVPRPSASRQDSNVTTEPTSPRQREFSANKDQEVVAPKVEVTSPASPVRQVSRQGLPVDGEQGVQLQDSQQSPQLVLPESPEEAAQEQELLEERQVRQPQVKVKKRTQQQERYLAELGIDRSLLEGRGLEFETLLADFGWRENVLQTKQLVDLEGDLKRELGRVEAGSWLSHTDAAREERVTQVENLLDKAIAECDELEGLLTLYSVELGSLNEDIAFIEAQSQGLQVQSANQKLLHTELSSLLDTMSLDRSVLQPLHYADLNDPSSLETVELSLVKLYQAMVTMDPSIRSATGSRKSMRDLETGNELSRMAALREKKDVYERESTQFCQRLLQHLDYAFTTSLNTAKSQAMKAPAGSGGAVRLNKDAFTLAKTGLWMYSPLVLFTKELTPPAWGTILRYYSTRAKPLYADAFKENIIGWKRAARKPTGEEAELLFTHQEKEGAESTSGSGLTSTARKLTVKRSQTLAKSLRNASGEKHSATENRNPGALSPSEIFAAAIDEMAPLISQEQNFMVDMFHATSLSTTDFIDSVSSSTPDKRRGTNLIIPKPTEPDREMARRVTGHMDEIFGFFTQETSVLLEWAVAGDPIQGVGVLASLSKHSFYLSGTSQEFLLQLIEQLSARLQTLWAKFVDEQIRAIEDTKVKIHKRKGVMRFMRVFPHFAAGVENTFAAVARADYEGPSDSVLDVRRLVDSAYSSINKAMFDSLKVIAKTSPTAPATAAVAAAGGKAGEDSEDKEMLNYHVLVIENMNHYIEEVDDGGREGVLAEWRGRAMLERAEALEAYVGRVVRRPLGKIMDFLDSIDSLLTSTPNPSTISSRPSYSRKSARTLLSAYDSKEIRRGIDTLRKRIEKHFGDADDEAISRTLVGLVGKECERAYERVVERLEKVVREVYPVVEGEKAVEAEFSREDVRAGFRR